MKRNYIFILCFFCLIFVQAFSGEREYVLVTGGAGYIGSHACKTLAQKGFIPITYDNLSRGHREAVKWGPLEKGDIRDFEKLKEVMQKYKPVAVFHFASLALVGESVQHPLMYYNNNVMGAVTLLEAMQECGIKKIVFSSTCATYGIPEDGSLIKETAAQDPINPYGNSKFMIEKIIKDTADASGMQYAILRYFNVAGADPECEVGENHEPETHLIPLALDAALYPEKCLTIFGLDYPTKDGTCIRDYIHVMDLVAAHVKAYQYMSDTQSNIIANLGIGQGYSIFDVINEIEAVTGKKVQTKHGSRREGDPPVLVADSSKGKELLKWECQYSNLHDIIKTAWHWHLHLKK